MSNKYTLPLKDVVNIHLNVSARAAARNAFNLCLLMGDIGSKVDFGDARIRTYTGTDEMLQDGFTLTDPLYKAASLVMGQSKEPPKVAIGRVMTKTAAGDSGTAVKETPAETYQACREADSEWVVGIYCDALTNEQIEAVAQYNESCTPDTIFAYTTSDPNCLTENGGIFKTLKDKKYRMTIGQYSSKDPNAIAAVIGYAMGSMTGTINSAYTLKFKNEVGVETENASGAFPSSKVEAIKENNGNVYINRGSYYDVFEEGTMADGSFFDEVIFLAKYKNDMQLTLMDYLYQTPKVGQTEPDMTSLKDKLITVCEEMRRVNFIAEGKWTGGNLLNLSDGDTLPGGYLVQSEPIADQSQADREARKAPPIYVCLKETGAIHSVTVEVNPNR